MKVVVTGGHGLVGRFVVSELIRPAPDGTSHDVTVFDRHARKSAPRQVSQVIGDHGDIDALLRVTEGADAVLHLAALQPAAAATEDVFGRNVQGTSNVFDAALRCGVKTVINWSSVWALGWSTPGNSFLPDYLPIDEAHPLRATDPYGRAKIEGEAIASTYHGRDGLRAVTLRPVFTATPRAMERLWGARRRYKPTWSHLSYVDARDHAVAARLALEHQSDTYLTAYVAADDSRIAESLSDVLPRLNPELGRRAADLTGTRSSIANGHAARVLGWRPQFSWRELSVAAKTRGTAAFLAGRTARAAAPNALIKKLRGRERQR